MLPKLPQQNKKREANFGVLFRRWIAQNPQYSCSLELKQTTTDSIAFSAIEPEQLAWGMAIESDKGALIRVIGTTGEPDYIYLRKTPAYVVIRYPSSFVLIHVLDFIEESRTSLRRSLTEKRAALIGKQILIQ